MKKSEIKEKIHPLGEGKSGKIVFYHDGEEHSFSTTINSLTGDRLSWFDNDPPSINDSMRWIKSVFVDVRKKAEVSLVVGDF